MKDRTPNSGDAPRHRVAVGTLAIVELFSWGTLYYAYPVAVPRISEATGWSTPFLAGVYSLSLLVAACAGVIISRLTDRAGDVRRVMPWCSLLGVVGMLISVTGGQWAFAAGWALVGIAQAGTLWGPAFIAITRWFETGNSSWPMTIVTAVGGSASLVFAPVVAYLTTDFGWRTTFVVLAAGYCVLAIPMQLLGLRSTWTSHPKTAAAPRRSVRATVANPRFIVLQVCMLATGVVLFSVTLNGVELALEKGASYAVAAIVFGLIGFGQVLGRIVFALLPMRLGPAAQTRALMLATGLAIAALAVAPSILLLALAAVFAGAVRGSHTLLMRNGVVDRYGSDNFGAVMGWFNLPVAIGIALSPLLGAGLADLAGGYTTAALIVAGLAVVTSLLAAKT